MPDPNIAISVRDLSKSYSITHNTTNHTTMAEAFVSILRRPRSESGVETFWALRDVEFDIHKGDIVGIIGRNGAGKSTLLKVLSRITEPTTGRIDIYGRVGSLLEVGTGFHAELTGRENIFMNGAILGMSRREIHKHFDDIVQFAEVEQFLDTPVKRYSSGMYVRLAFAVAAHLDPEILIVDEVLAVGDSAFQKKCLGKMQDVSRQEGRTILFVSHQIAAIQTLCSKVVVLKQGQVAYNGGVSDGIKAYLRLSSTDQDQAVVDLHDRKDRLGSGPARVVRCELLHKEQEVIVSPNEFQIGEGVGIAMTVASDGPATDVSVGYAIRDVNGTHLFTSHHEDALDIRDIPTGETIFTSWIDPNYLQPGRYTLEVGILVRGATSDFVPDVAQIDIIAVLGSAGSKLDGRPGAMRIDFPWHVAAGQEAEHSSVSLSEAETSAAPVLTHARKQPSPHL